MLLVVKLILQNKGVFLIWLKNKGYKLQNVIFCQGNVKIFLIDLNSFVDEFILIRYMLNFFLF